MMFVLVRWIIFIVAFFAIIMIGMTKKNKSLRLVFCVVVIVFAVLTLQLSVYVESATMTFASCEKAFQYKYNKECSICVDGEMTALAKGDETVDVFLKTVDGYKMRTSLFLSVYHMVYDDFSYVVYKYAGTNEHYLIISSIMNEIDLSKNEHLKFIVSEEGNVKSYYAYLPDFEKGYTLIINDNEIML